MASCTVIIRSNTAGAVFNPLSLPPRRGLVQQGLSAAGGALGFYWLGLGADKRHLSGVTLNQLMRYTYISAHCLQGIAHPVGEADVALFHDQAKGLRVGPSAGGRCLTRPSPTAQTAFSARDIDLVGSTGMPTLARIQTGESPGTRCMQIRGPAKGQVRRREAGCFGPPRRNRGVGAREAWNISKSAPGPWRLTHTPALHLALHAKMFRQMGRPELAPARAA